MIMRFAGVLVGVITTTLASGAQSAASLASVDFSACANVVASFGQPVGASAGNALTNFSKLKFTLIDPTAADNVWAGTNGGSIDIKVSIASPIAVYMLMNTFYGQGAIVNGTVTFKGTNKTHRFFKLTGNANIRDYNNWVWTNVINGTTAQEWWTNNLNPQPQDQSKRVDAHRFNLGTTFTGQTLTDIVVTAPSNAGANYMEPALFAVGVHYVGASGVAPSTCTTK